MAACWPRDIAEGLLGESLAARLGVPPPAWNAVNTSKDSRINPRTVNRVNLRFDAFMAR